MRALLYSPDSYGLGHVRRSLSIAGALVASGRPGTAVRLLTGAPRAHYFDYPSACDYLKLPVVSKGRGGCYVGGDLDLSLDETVRLRSRIIDEATSAFGPHVFLVDHSPLGLCGEALPTLRALARSSRRTLRVLGLRDVIDEPDAVRAAWAKDGALDVLRRDYDAVLVYGQPDVFDPIAEYGIPADVARRVTFVGYVPRTGSGTDPRALRARHAPRTGRLVLLTLGGGGDGDRLLAIALRAMERVAPAPSFELLAVTGPLMSPRKRERFKERARHLSHVSLIEYTRALPDLMRAADVVVSMGGYNTVAELACAGARAIVVPRIEPRREQLVRALRLEARGLLRCLAPTALDPATLELEIGLALEREAPPVGWGLEFGGLSGTVELLRRLGGEAALVRPRPIVPEASLGVVP